MQYANEYPNAIDVKAPGFMGAVYGFFALALLITAGGTFGGFYIASLNPGIYNEPLVLYGSLAFFIIMGFTAHRWSRALPLGYLIFTLYALLTGFIMTPILATAGAMGGALMIVKALIASGCVFTAAGLYGAFTKTNLLGMGGFLFMALIGLIGIHIFGIFFPWGSTMELVMSGSLILLFSGYTMYYIQVLQRTNLASPLLGAIMLYISFINIFISILRFMITLGRD